MLPSEASASEVQITFDDAIYGATSYAFDADGDGQSDALFTTDDPYGFNTVGPGPYMTYINEPGLEGSSNLPVSLRIEFLVGATGSLSFGFAVSEVTEDYGCTVSVFDQAGNLLGSTFTQARFTTLPSGEHSSFPEGLATVAFAGVGRYATVSFSNNARYILDNFTGSFGTTQRLDRFSLEGFMSPVGKAHRLGSTLPLKLNLFLDDAPITSQEALDAALDSVSFPLFSFPPRVEPGRSNSLTPSRSSNSLTIYWPYWTHQIHPRHPLLVYTSRKQGGTHT